MGRCVYCGQSAGLFRKHHVPCKEQHDHALVRIPDFVRKFLESDLPADRFCQLLQEGAKASFINEAELSQAVARGMSKGMDRALEERLLNGQELERFSKVADTLAPVLSHNSEVHEKMAKLDVLLQLADGRVPDLVDVGGDLPIDLRRGETVVWIFNNVPLYRDRTDEAAPQQLPAEAVGLNKSEYVRPSAVSDTKLPPGKLREEARGDLVTTNRNLFFVRGIDQITRLPFPRISEVRAFSEGLEITSEAGKRRVFALDDVWFGANLLIGLLRLMRS